MIMEGSTEKSLFKELQRNPLFFMKKGRIYSEVGENVYGYKSVRKEIETIIDDENNEISQEKYILLVVDEYKEEPNEKVTFRYHIADPERDMIVIINSLIFRSQQGDKNLPFIYLLWFLNYSNWTINQLTNAIREYDVKSQPFIFKWLGKIACCLSLQRQQQIKTVFENFNKEYRVNDWEQLKEAIEHVDPSKTNHYEQYNLFELIDFVFENSLCNDFDDMDLNLSNTFICLYKWLETNEPLENYDLLKNIYSFVSEDTQLRIIKRYFHDVRLENTNIDYEILKQLRENKFERFRYYRYCISTPEERINLGNQLLCDCILTLHETGGTSFQGYNGILDFAINRCDRLNPNIDLGLLRFLPKCEDSVVCNERFKGFIDYAIIFSIKEEKFNSKNIYNTKKLILDEIGEKRRYFSCKYDETHAPLCEDSKCLHNEWQLECVTSRLSDKWIVKRDKEYLRLIVDEEKIQDKTKEEFEIGIDDVSEDKIRNLILNIISKLEKVTASEYIIQAKDMDSFEYKLILDYSVPQRMRIYQRENAYIGSNFDILAVCSTSDENITQTEQLARRVKESLKSFIGDHYYNGEFFETQYDENRLNELKGLYYYKGADAGKGELAFLRNQYISGYPVFCAPKLAREKNRATNLPYFWCRGKQCFHNALEKQILQNTSSELKYTLFHMVEILGYPKLHNIGGCYEPDKVISTFIAVANKVMKMIKLLKCRECGHLMYAENGGNFNTYYYYSCINPICKEHKTRVYLNYCYGCKDDIIDSRNSKKCPNGHYICGNCLSCCNDNVFERMARRYVLEGKQVPFGIRMKLDMGHNNKGVFFCPDCGNQLHKRGTKNQLYCEQCDKTFKHNDKE